MTANKIKDKGNDHKYWVGIPQIVWAKAKDPYEISLWLVIKMIAGDEGECYLSTPDLATAAMMSAGKASQCRKSLIKSGLLTGEIRKDPGYPQPVWHLTIPDLWPENISWRQKNPGLKDRIGAKKKQRESLHPMKSKEPSPGEEGLSPGEEGLSPGETKNNHIEPKENPHDARASAQPPAETPPIQEPVGEALITEYFGEKPMREKVEPTPHWTEQAAQDWATWGYGSDEMERQVAAFGSNGHSVRKLGHELEQQFGLRPLWGDKKAVKTWMSGLATCLQEADYDPQLVIQACRELAEAELTISNPWSLRKKTAALAALRRSPHPASLGIDAPSPYL